MLKYKKVTKLKIEPRIFWTYTRCSNQLSYLALEFNRPILYLCNCQSQDTYSAIPYMSDQPYDWDMIKSSQSENHVTNYIIQIQYIC